ncbi:DUF6174 domain-containing protein [Thiofilum flexile]|uniref:DUF6174 domain-containing protein n=1 Tax=Thiofilum flexile TaxID=125627 RepID=UPI000365BE0E|nr:DUF6174 domain-containing protein [Thiofilum flexile]
MSTINTTRLNIPRPHPTIVGSPTNSLTNRSSPTPSATIPATLSTPVQNISQQTTAQVHLPVSGYTGGIFVPGSIGPGGGTLTPTQARQQLSDARTRWANQGLNSYTLALSTGSLGDETLVDVVNGQVVHAANRYTADPANSTLAQLTVSDLFDLAEQAINEGMGSSLRFSERGIPSSIRVGDKHYSGYIESVITPATAGNDTVVIATPLPAPISTTAPRPFTISMEEIAYGNKTYWGGAGQDTAVFAGKLSDYFVQTPPNGEIKVTPASEYAALQPVTIKDFEVFQFADISLSKEQLKNPAATLDYRRQQWQAQGLNNYSLSVEKFTDPNQVPRTITASPAMWADYQSAQLDILNGRVVQASGTKDNSTLSPELANLTIDALFDLAQQAINRGEKVEINYNAKGIPASILIGTTQYRITMQSDIIAGSTRDDHFTAQFATDPSLPTGTMSNMKSTRYIGDTGNDTLTINGRLRDFNVTQPLPSHTGSFDIQRSSGGSYPVSTSGIEHLQFSDATIEAAELKPQILNYYQKQWNNFAPQDYILDVIKFNDQGVYPYRNDTQASIEVKNGQIASVSAKDMRGNATTPDPELANLTADKLFTLAQQMLTDNPKTEITYNRDRGYPGFIQLSANNSRSGYSAHLRLPGEPEIPQGRTSIGVGSVNITDTGITPYSGVTPATISPTSGTTPLTPATIGHSNTSPSTAQNTGRIQIDPQVLTRVLTVLRQLINTMQANHSSSAQATR